MSERNVPLKIIITAAVSAIVFIASVAASIVIGARYGGLKSQYEEIYSEQKALEAEIFNKNSAYYAEILENGFDGITGGKEAVRKAVQQFYRYRLKLDGKPINQESYPLNKKSCIITVEEYYVSYATNYLPESVLNYFKYLNNKGAGGGKTPDGSVYEDILQENDFSITVWGCEKTVERHDESNMTVINISVSNMVPGSSGISIRLSQNFKKNFNLNDIMTSIEIWTVV